MSVEVFYNKMSAATVSYASLSPKITKEKKVEHNRLRPYTTIEVASSFENIAMLYLFFVKGTCAISTSLFFSNSKSIILK